MSDRNPVLLYGKQTRDSLARCVPRDRPVALLGFSDPGNCSEHATWLGETKLVADLGLPISYRASAQSYRREALAANIGNGTIFLHGSRFGGNSPLDREFQLRVLQDFPNKTIFLPQHLSSRDHADLPHAAA